MVECSLMKALEKERAFDIFLKGNSIRETANVVGVSRSSVERWSRQGLWNEKREKNWTEMRERRREELLIDKISEFKKVSSDLLEVFKQGHDELMQYMRGERTKRSLRFSIAELSKIAFVATRCNNLSLEGIMREKKILENEMKGWTEEDLKNDESLFVA